MRWDSSTDENENRNKISSQTMTLPHKSQMKEWDQGAQCCQAEEAFSGEEDISISQ